VQFFKDMKVFRSLQSKPTKPTSKSTPKEKTNIKVFGLNFRDTPVAVYFAGNVNNYYQIVQWMQPFEKLNEPMRIVFVLRDLEVYHKFTSEYPAYQTVYLKSLNDLTSFYDMNNIKVILYVNNGVKNFQSLINTKAYHIHINHGESEKESMYSNQAKAYDYVFVVGDRAVERYKEHLLNFNEAQFVKIGRPQLDYIEPISIENPENKKVILYAPTWEATHESMNYSSVAKYGELLINLLIMSKKYIVIYKPHSAMGTKNAKIKTAHNNIIKIINEYQDGYVFQDEAITNIFPIVDFAFFDNTSVMIDYLDFQRPGAYLKIKEDASLKHLLEGLTQIDENNFSKVLSILEDELEHDTKKVQRAKIKEYYLGNYRMGESTQKFIEEIMNMAKRRDEEIEQKYKE